MCAHPPSPSPPQLQFDVTNTLEDQLLTNVRVEMEEPDGFKVVECIPIESLPYNKPGTTYTIVELAEPDTGRERTLCLLSVCDDGSAKFVHGNALPPVICAPSGISLLPNPRGSARSSQ